MPRGAPVTLHLVERRSPGREALVAENIACEVANDTVAPLAPFQPAMKRASRRFARCRRGTRVLLQHVGCTSWPTMGRFRGGALRPALDSAQAAFERLFAGMLREEVAPKVPQAIEDRTRR